MNIPKSIIEKNIKTLGNKDKQKMETNGLRETWIQNRIEIKRPSWNDTFLSIAYTISKRSHDAQTQCGAVITDKSYRILGVGYNGFVRNIDDSWLPNIRPLKYDFMLHAEENCLFNCEHRPENGILFVTGRPCLHCLQIIYQSGISKIVYDTNHKINMISSPEYEEKYQGLLFLLKHKIEIIPYNFKKESME